MEYVGCTPTDLKTDSGKALREELTADYWDLVCFTGKLEGFGISEERFQSFFWEGATRSLEFYRSSGPGEQRRADRFLETGPWRHPDLGHPVEPPKKERPRLSQALGALDRFAGKWHGKWGTAKVHHLWLPVRKCEKRLADGFTLMGFQSCFTGDGFGWNYVARKKNRILILGCVYHFDRKGSRVSQVPHYAFLSPKNQLTWITPDHLYHEFVCQDARCREQKHYVITGGRYKKQHRTSAWVSGFQAVYLPEDQELPAFTPLVPNKLARAQKYVLKRLVGILNRFLFQ